MLEKYNRIISYGIQPIRIIGITSMLWQFLNGDPLSDPSPMFFTFFIPLYLSSLVIEAILTSMKGKGNGFVSLSTKYAQLLPVQFVGVTGFAMLTYAPHTIPTFWLAIKLALVVLACEIGIEGYHKFIIPRLNRIKLPPRVEALAVVGMTVSTFFGGFYYLVLHNTF